MKLVPANIEEQINRVDRQRSLYIGITAAVIAVLSLFRLVWALYLALTFDWMFGSMVFQMLLLAVVGSVAGIAAVGFLTRYNRGS
jgi:ABC-type antimicrobial peptide transport system permease subunit